MGVPGRLNARFICTFSLSYVFPLLSLEKRIKENVFYSNCFPLIELMFLFVQEASPFEALVFSTSEDGIF